MKDKKEKKDKDEVELKLWRYRHYKGKFYWVHSVAKHSETLEKFVCYECLYENEEGKYWVRPLKMFLEEVEVDGRKVKRFEYIEPMKGDGWNCEDCDCEHGECKDDHCDGENCGHCCC